MTDDRREGLPDAPKRPPHRKRRARWRAKLDALAWHIDKLVQIEEVIERLVGAEKVSGQAVAALFSRALDVRAGIERIQASRPWMAGATIEELREWLERSLDDWPDEFLELAIRIYQERHKGRVFFVHEGGSKVELGDDGWEPAKEA